MHSREFIFKMHSLAWSSFTLYLSMVVKYWHQSSESPVLVRLSGCEVGVWSREGTQRDEEECLTAVSLWSLGQEVVGVSLEHRSRSRQEWVTDTGRSKSDDTGLGWNPQDLVSGGQKRAGGCSLFAVVKELMVPRPSERLARSQAVMRLWQEEVSQR